MFPSDDIMRTRGRGADILQTVMDSDGKARGEVYYESKIAKDFKGEWIAKFVKDMQRENAFADVFLAKTMPGPKHHREIAKIGDNVWFLSHDHLKDIAPVIRRFPRREKEIEKLRKSKGTGKMNSTITWLATSSAIGLRRFIKTGEICVTARTNCKSGQPGCLHVLTINMLTKCL